MASTPFEHLDRCNNYFQGPYPGSVIYGPGSAGPWRMTPTTVDGVPPLSSRAFFGTLGFSPTPQRMTPTMVDGVPPFSSTAFFGSLGFSPAPQRIMTSMYDHRPAWSSKANFGNPREDCITGLPNVDWYETAPELVFKTDIAGLSKKDVQVHVDDEEFPYGRTLTISWHYKGEKAPPETDKRHVLECDDRQLSAIVTLPKNANLDAVTASVAGGVLTVVVPMLHKKAHGSRTIEIDRLEEPIEIMEAAP